MQHGARAGVRHDLRPAAGEAVLCCGADLPRGVHQERRGDEPVGGIRLLPVAGLQTAGFRLVHLLWKLRAHRQAGPGGDSPRSSRKHGQLHMGASVGRRQLRRARPAARRLRGGEPREGGGGAMVLPGRAAEAPVDRRFPHPLRLELDLGEHMVRGSAALLPPPHRSVHESETGGQ